MRIFFLFNFFALSTLSQIVAVQSSCASTVEKFELWKRNDEELPADFERTSSRYPVVNLEDGDKVCYEEFGDNIEAVMSCPDEVWMEIDDAVTGERLQTRKEGVEPYFLYGNWGEVIRGRTLEIGKYTVTATPVNNPEAKTSINFEVIQCDRCEVETFRLWFKNDEDLPADLEQKTSRYPYIELKEGDKVCYEDFGDNIEAVMSCQDEVWMKIDDAVTGERVKTRKESLEPYFVFGNWKDIIHGQTLEIGKYTMTAYAANNEDAQRVVNFEVVDCNEHRVFSFFDDGYCLDSFEKEYDVTSYIWKSLEECNELALHKLALAEAKATLENIVGYSYQDGNFTSNGVSKCYLFFSGGIRVDNVYAVSHNDLLKGTGQVTYTLKDDRYNGTQCYSRDLNPSPCESTVDKIYLWKQNDQDSPQDYSFRYPYVELQDGDKICYEDIGDNIEAVMSCQGEVWMEIENAKTGETLATTKDSIPPYFLFGNSRGTIYGQTLEIGNYTLTVYAVENEDAKENIKFEVLECNPQFSLFGEGFCKDAYGRGYETSAYYVTNLDKCNELAAAALERTDQIVAYSFRPGDITFKYGSTPSCYLQYNDGSLDHREAAWTPYPSFTGQPYRILDPVPTGYGNVLGSTGVKGTYCYSRDLAPPTCAANSTVDAFKLWRTGIQMDLEEDGKFCYEDVVVNIEAIVPCRGELWMELKDAETGESINTITTGSFEPYFLYENVGGNINGQVLPIGMFTLTAYMMKNEDAKEVINFEVVGCAGKQFTFFGEGICVNSRGEFYSTVSYSNIVTSEECNELAMHSLVRTDAIWGYTYTGGSSYYNSYNICSLHFDEGLTRDEIAAVVKPGFHSIGMKESVTGPVADVFVTGYNIESCYSRDEN